MLHERGKRIETNNKKQLKMEGVQREAKEIAENFNIRFLLTVNERGLLQKGK